MRKPLLVAAVILSTLSLAAVSARADKWCDDPANDQRAAQQRLPQQGVVQVHHLAEGNHYVASSIDDDGRLGTITLAGHDGYTPLVATWQSPAMCAGAAGMTRTGAWGVTAAGHVFTDGNVAGQFGDMASKLLNRPIVGMSPTSTGEGYWLVASDGGIFSFGDARFLGSTGALTLNQPIVAMAATPTGDGYWLAAADGGLFSFGDARFLGSMGGTHLNKPIVGMVPTSTGLGYWMVASDGGIFTFGDAVYKGSTASEDRTTPIVGMVPNGTTGYRLVDEEGTISSFPSNGTTTTPTTIHDHDGSTDTTTPDGTGPIISVDDPRVTPTQRAAAVDLIDRTATGMAIFPDEAAVIAAGYTTIGDSATGFEHYVNWSYLTDSSELDESKIESVVLRVAADGTKTVESAMYILSIGKTMSNVPEIAGDLTTWHDHENLCFEGTRVIGLADESGHCARGILLVTPPMLHVWITPQPCGPFAGIETGGHGSSCHTH